LAWIWVVVVFLVACGGGGPTVSEYAGQSEDLVTVLLARLDALDAEWEAQAPTPEGARTYWDRRLEARTEFLEGIEALDPPGALADLHERALDLFSRLTAAEQALAARVATSETVTEHGPWWNTPEGRAARRVDHEAVAICHAAQERFDATQDKETLADVAWITSEMKDVVRVAFGCPEIAAPVIGGDFLSEQLARILPPEGQGAAMVAVVDADGTVDYASEGSDPAGSPLTPNEVFRIGSITEVFSAALTLALVDDGLVDLDSPVIDYVTRVRVPDGVAVRDLLQHTSGILDFTLSPHFWSRAVDDPQRVWSPEETIGLVESRAPLFEPGASFSYSNTNYAMLGVLIEEVTGMPFAATLRDCILEPLSLDSTYLAGFEEGPVPFGAYTALDGSTKPIDFEYTAIATDAGAAGAIVSSVADLHTLLSALFDGRVISAGSLAAMTGNDEYGFGIVRFPEFEELYGHRGGIPGYRTFVMHAADTGRTVVWVVTNDTADLDPWIDSVADYLSQP
jgi:D-alanyl-D-alanine carboxypeptidase